MKSSFKLLQEIENIWKIADWKTFFVFLLNIVRFFSSIVRTRSLVAVDQGMRNRNCRFQVCHGREVKIAIDNEGLFFGIAREIYGRNVYLKTLDFQIQPNDVVIDLGANAGLFTTMAALCGASVYAVEAQSDFLPLIEANLLANKCLEQVTLIHGLIGSGSGVFSQAAARSSASHWNLAPQDLSMRTLLDTAELAKVDFLKIDIEGSEFDLFQDSDKWLERIHAIAIEIHPEFGDVAKLRAILIQAGFSVVQTDNDQKVVDIVTGETGYLFASKHTFNGR